MTTLTLDNSYFSLEGMRAELADFPTKYCSIVGKKISAALERIKNTVDSSNEFHAALGKADAIFETVTHQIEPLDIPLEIAEKGLEWTTLISILEVFSHAAHAALEGVGTMGNSLKMITSIAKLKKMGQQVFGTAEKAKDALKFSEIAVLGFSVMSGLCGVLVGMQKMGLITHTVALIGRVTLIGCLCNLLATSLELMNSVKNYSTMLKVVKAFLNCIVAAIGLFLVFYAVAHVHLLLLILGTGTLIMSVATKKPEV